jgi:hypothetical protein
MVLLRNPLMLRDPRRRSGRARTRYPGRELIVLNTHIYKCGIIWKPLDIFARVRNKVGKSGKEW